MRPVVHYLDSSAQETDALFASELQPGDEPDAGEVRRAIAAAIQTFGYSGCVGRVAQEFGDHPEAAVTRMRWARALADEESPEQTAAPGALTDADAPLLEAIAREALGSLYTARQVLLTRGETRVLRYLPTHLSAREIAAELYLSPNTVKTHQRHLYEKLGAHSRAQAVERARALGLLTRPSRGGVLAAAVWGASA